MDGRDGFLSAIHDEPDDDVHRLVFADWLEDHDEPEWSALIRHQCGLARLLEPSADPFADAGSVDIVHLTQGLRRSLLGLLDPMPTPFVADPEIPNNNRSSLFVRRGLPEVLRLVGDDALAAVIQVLEGTSGTWARAVRCLSINQSFSQDGYHNPFDFIRVSGELVGRFFRSRFLSNFNEIDVRGVAFNAHRAISLPRRWPPNTRLWVSGRRIGMTADLERLQKRVGPRLVVDPEHPSDQTLFEDSIPF